MNIREPVWSGVVAELNEVLDPSGKTREEGVGHSHSSHFAELLEKAMSLLSEVEANAIKK